ncbi:MAG TPA: hemolysin family protein [Candidatus Dormibacteraeota bacterium]|nr:hemolysin family protein [Candidatus Dormibacteraeota bacterium]
MDGYIALLVVALLVAAFAASAETGLNSVSRIRMRTLAEGGDRRALIVVELHNDPNAFLSTILSLNTVAIIVATTAATLLATDMNDVNQAVVTACLSLVTLVACEIAPKSLALRYSERVSLAYARPVRALTGLLRPVIFTVTWLGTVPLRILARGVPVRGPFVTEEEIKQQIAEAEREGVVEQEEREMIQGVLELTDKVAREVMVPRVDVAGVEAAGSVDDVVAVIIDTGHSRIPIYEKTIDDVVGIVYAKDVLRHRGRAGVTLRELARDPYFTPEAKRAGDLLHDMQVRKVHIAVVVDEYGGTAGIITIEDLLEEIVGEIRDEYDVAEQEHVQFLSDREVLVSARLSLEDVKDMLALEVDPEDIESDSVGGLVYERLGAIPKPGATVQIGDMTLTVETVRRQSIRTVRIVSPRPFDVERNGRREPAPDEPAEAHGDGEDAAGDRRG